MNSMNRYHDNCCHLLDEKTPALVNHGRSSKSNVGDTFNFCCNSILQIFTSYLFDGNCQLIPVYVQLLLFVKVIIRGVQHG